MAYGAGAFHDPKNPVVARKLGPSQNRCLRYITGAFKDTPTKNLEIEAFCPPLDLYFDKRLADFESRLEKTGMRQKIISACAVIAIALRNRRHRPCPTKSFDHSRWAKSWIQRWAPNEITENNPEKPSTVALKRAWEARWNLKPRRPQSDPQSRASDLAAGQAFNQEGLLALHKGLKKAQSLALVQARTGKIGLQAYLFHRHILKADTDQCPCRNGVQTPEHLFINCTDKKSASLRALGLTTNNSVRQALSSTNIALKLAKLLLESGWLPYFNTA